MPVRTTFLEGTLLKFSSQIWAHAYSDIKTKQVTSKINFFFCIIQ